VGFKRKKIVPGESKALEGDVKAFREGQLPPEKQDFCSEWLRKRGIFAARLFFGFSLLFHILTPLVSGLWLNAEDVMLEKIRLIHSLGIVYSVVLVLVLDRGFKKIGIIYGAAQFYLNAGSILMIVFEIIFRRPEIHLLQAYMVSTAVSIVSLIASPFSRPWMTGVIFLQNLALIAIGASFDKSSGLSIALWHGFISALGWTLQSKLVVKSIRDALQEFESQKILALLARVHLDQELSLARHIEESLLPPDKLDIGPYLVECYRHQSTQIGGHWYAVRADGEGGLYALMCEAPHQGIHGALILHAVQSLWAEDLGRPSIDPESWLHKANRALFVLGQTEVHELEVTLVHLRGSTMTYWGAGQRALFLMSDDPGAMPGIRLLARDVLRLGISEHIFPTAVNITLEPMDRVFLGNKAVFPGGDFCRASDLIKIHQDLHATLERPPLPGTNEHGRSLVVISRREVPRQLLRLKHA